MRHVPCLHTVMIRAAVVGASGYSGAELLRILSSRRDVSIVSAMAGSTAGKTLDELYPTFTGRLDIRLDSLDPATLNGVDVVFAALPSGESMKTVPGLLSRVGKVIDLSGDFRLPDAGLYRQFYTHEHAAPSLLGCATYGLPELNRDVIASARFITNPGCYPTSAILGLLPALAENLIDPKGIVINSLSGTTGAGRSSSVELSFAEVNENIRAYKIGVHQHTPEIEHVLSSSTKREVSVSFVPHLVPLSRGIYTTIHANLAPAALTGQVHEVYEQFYADEPWVRIRTQIPQIRDVLYTNYCDIGVTVDPRTNQLVIVSVIDNLIKGAAGQAIQNMNIMFGLPEEAGCQ